VFVTGMKGCPLFTPSMLNPQSKRLGVASTGWLMADRNNRGIQNEKNFFMAFLLFSKWMIHWPWLKRANTNATAFQGRIKDLEMR
jgi:hypothetical protein